MEGEIHRATSPHVQRRAPQLQNAASHYEILWPFGTHFGSTLVVLSNLMVRLLSLPLAGADIQQVSCRHLSLAAQLLQPAIRFILAHILEPSCD